MTEKQVMEYLEQAGAYGIVPGLDGIGRLCERLGNPQKELRFVHIVGTNGKGSVSAYLSSALECAGYRVGRYTSPAVFEYREKIQAAGRMISRRALCQGMERIKAACGEIVSEDCPTLRSLRWKRRWGFCIFRRKNAISW